MQNYKCNDRLRDVLNDNDGTQCSPIFYIMYMHDLCNYMRKSVSRINNKTYKES